MADPIVEKIAEAIETAINAITTGNGYNYTLTAVRPKRIHLETDVNDDQNVIIFQDEQPTLVDFTNASGVGAYDKITWLQGFQCQAICIDSDTATEAIDTKLNKIRSDIEKKMLSSATITLGGLGRVIPKPPVYFTQEPQASVVSVNFDVEYETDFDDPYTQT